MPQRLHVGNLNPSLNELDVEALFAPYGFVRRAELSSPSCSGRSSGTALVEMGTFEESVAAITALNDHNHWGYPLTVAWATSGHEADGEHPSLFGPMNMATGSSRTGAPPQQKDLIEQRGLAPPTDCVRFAFRQLGAVSMPLTGPFVRVPAEPLTRDVSPRAGTPVRKG